MGVPLNPCALDLQIVYTSAIQGIAGDEPDAMEGDMEPLFKAIMGMPKPYVKETAPLQVWIATLSKSFIAHRRSHVVVGAIS